MTIGPMSIGPMTIGEVFDVLLCVTIIAVALGAVAGRELFASVALFIAYGLLLAIAWVRLDAINVALAEAAIGAGLTGVLLLSAVARLERAEPVRPRTHAAAFVLCFAVAGGLATVMLALARADTGLGPLVAANLALAEVDNSVTAVLLNFRAWDTLLEVAVLFVALVAVWSLAPGELWDGRPGLRQDVSPDGLLATFGRFLPPIGLVVGVYLVWVGTSAPGGAFQAATVLAAVWLLSMLAGLMEPPAAASTTLRWVLVAGPLLFLGIGVFGLTQGAFLRYPAGYAKAMILAIEFALALSIAATLALLVLGAPRRRR